MIDTLFSEVNINMIVKVAEDAGLTNEQCYLDWEDYLNRISVMEH